MEIVGGLLLGLVAGHLVFQIVRFFQAAKEPRPDASSLLASLPPLRPFGLPLHELRVALLGCDGRTLAVLTPIGAIGNWERFSLNLPDIRLREEATLGYVEIRDRDGATIFRDRITNAPIRVMETFRLEVEISKSVWSTWSPLGPLNCNK